MSRVLSSRRFIHTGPAVEVVVGRSRSSGEIYSYVYDECESIGGYQSEGYHPVHLYYEYSDNHYQIIYKLGSGSSSTVWLARDRLQNQFVALKIIVAGQTGSHSESRVLRNLQSAKDPGGTSCRYVSRLLDNFHTDGPNGRHQCLALKSVGSSVAESKKEATQWMFPLKISRAIIAKAIFGVQAIQSRGIVHDGKLSRRIISPPSLI